MFVAKKKQKQAMRPATSIGTLIFFPRFFFSFFPPLSEITQLHTAFWLRALFLGSRPAQFCRHA